MNALANLLVLPSKFNLAVLPPKVVPRGSRGVSRRLQGALWEALGFPWDRLGPTWDHFRIVLRSFWDHLGSFWDLLGIFLGSFGDHLGVAFSIFQNSVLEAKL